MEKLSKIEMTLQAQTLYKKILTPEQASVLTMVSVDRLISLANSGYAPALWIDGSGPYFKGQDIVKWAKENLVRAQKEQPLKIEVKVIVAEAARPADVPLVLSQMSSMLKVYPWREAASAVYFLVKGEDVVYVGQSRNLSYRITTHSSGKEFDRVFYIPVPSASLNDVESALIRTIRPKLNETCKKPSTEDDLLSIQNFCHPRVQAEIQ